MMGIRARNRAARLLSEVFQPPVVVTALLLVSPALEPGFPGNAWFGAVAAFFVCVLPLGAVLLLVKLGKVTDHHVSRREQRAPVLAMAVASLLVGLGVLTAINAPQSVVVMVLAVVGGVVLTAVVSLFWKISGHAGAIAASTAIAVLMLGAAWSPLLLLIPAVAWSRVVVRAHTVAQVVAGAFISGGLITGLWWILTELTLHTG